VYVPARERTHWALWQKKKKVKKKPAPVGIPFSEMPYIIFLFSCDTRRVPTRYPMGFM